MTFQNWDELLKFCEVFTKWPPVVLFLAFLFRGVIARKLGNIQSIKVKETEIVFKRLRIIAQNTTPELLKQFILTVRPASLTASETEAEDDTDADEEEPDESEVDDINTGNDAEAERVQLEQILRDLQDNAE